MTPNKTILLLLFCFLGFSQSAMVWNKPKDWNIGLPNSIQVFQTNSSFTPGVKLTASYCLIDLADPDLQFKVVHSGGKMKVLPEYIEDEPNDVYMIVNGGYFNMITNISISLVIADKQVIDYSVDPEVHKYNGHNVPYYPTPAAIGIYENNTVEFRWTYGINRDPKQVYAYPQPAANCMNCPPQMMPGKVLPKGGYPWGVSHALGAGPMLITNGVVNVTAQQELKFVSDVRNPRTAVCVTNDNKLAVIVADGRYDLSDGLLLVELAGVMKEIGCKDAVNFDGGGSSAMIVNGYLTNRPSDKTGYRPVPSALMLVKKKKTQKITA